MWVTKLLISQVNKKDFLPQNDQIWPKIGIFGQFWPGHAGLLVTCWWVGWWLWRAGCISQDTYLLYRNRSAVKILKVMSSTSQGPQPTCICSSTSKRGGEPGLQVPHYEWRDKHR